jgi:hypothetical protein
MAGKKGSMVNLDNIGSIVNREIKPKQQVKTGRPKLNPYPAEKKITMLIPADVHRQLRLASADTGKPMTEIAIDSLKKYLRSYEGK